jgi:hypothetical protein
VVQVKLVAAVDLIDGNGEEVQQFINHGLAFQSFRILLGQFITLHLVSIEGGERVVVDQ